ncbi:MAG: hypothetical protein LBG68_03605 [Coriobacteriales bacterium]|nr:hypothetical protein [Coriobacteriales bacterium]
MTDKNDCGGRVCARRAISASNETLYFVREWGFMFFDIDNADNQNDANQKHCCNKAAFRSKIPACEKIHSYIM